MLIHSSSYPARASGLPSGVFFRGCGVRDLGLTCRTLNKHSERKTNILQRCTTTDDRRLARYWDLQYVLQYILKNVHR